MSDAPTITGRIEARGFHFYRDGRKWMAKGVTYGPFRPGPDGAQFPPHAVIDRDLDMMSAAGINTLRVYTTPSEDLAAAALARDIQLLVDIPWPKHLDVYGNPELERMCIDMAVAGAQQTARWTNVLGVFVGNEIPPDAVRWATPVRVEAFLRRLRDAVKAVEPSLLVGYANFPSTEYLRPDFLDFFGFNVYLESEEALRSYLHRLRHLYPETPLLLSETGLDSKSNGEDEQARVIKFSLSAAMSTGLAGAIVFSWTDEWHTGGHDISGWNFGLVTRNRAPKPALNVVLQSFVDAPRVPLTCPVPMVSVIVASYNGGATLRECLISLGQLNYPNYEVLVVDDGSTDDTPEILRDFPSVRVVTQPNRGLSVARNEGISAARGEIVAFTDSDCVADSDWLHHMVSTMLASSCAGAGGPNLTPWETRPLHRTVAHAPGHATHVLLNEHEAEHVPGCNMAFFKRDIEEVGFFNPIYRKAGDDVDIIWRLYDAGKRVLFAPGAFVWHHRRCTVGAYLKQQCGYGEAEALLARQHPHRFNDRGQSLWKGVIYSGRDLLPLVKPHDIHYGVFASAGFQCIYERRSGIAPHFLTSFEWWILCALLVAAGIFSGAALAAGLAGIALAVAISGFRAWRGFRNSSALSAQYFPIVWLLWILQPIVRGYKRFVGLFAQRPQSAGFRRDLLNFRGPDSEPRSGGNAWKFWSERGAGRMPILRRLMAMMNGHGWQFAPNTGWEPWDCSVILSQWFRTRVTSAEEDHGAGRKMLRLRYTLAPTSLFGFFVVTAMAVCLLTAFQDTVIARIAAVVFILAGWRMYAVARASQRMVACEFAKQLEMDGYFPVTSPAPAPAPAPNPISAKSASNTLKSPS